MLSQWTRRQKQVRRRRQRRLNRAALEQLEERTLLAGIWISPEQVMALPTTGAAWQSVVDAAQQEIGLPNLQDQDEVTDVLTLAKALVAVRLDNQDYLSQVRDTVWDVIGTESVAGTVTFADPSAIETTATFSAPGTYLLRLHADDGQFDDEDELTIRVHADGDVFTPTGDAALDGSGQITITGSSGGSNDDPDVYAGADQIVSVNDVVTLRGGVEDDGLPGAGVTTTWEVVEPRTLALGRNLVSYVIAADLVGLEPARNIVFRDWLRELLTKEIDGRTIQSTHEERPNNWGTMAAASRAAVAVYLGDQVELDRTAQVFRGYLGDRSAYAGFTFDDDLSWHADPTTPVGINPVGATKDGFSIDGAQPEEMRRGGSFQFPPEETQYPWEGLQGAVVTAEILHRAGFDAWEWQDRAILRAVEFLNGLQWAPNRDDEWTPWVIDARYGTDFAINDAADAGKNMGWTSWTHFLGAPGENLPPVVNAGPDQAVADGAIVVLSATVTDDGLPDPPSSVSTQWTLQSGPAAATATFADSNALDTTVQLSEPGTYVLHLSASDGELTVTDAIKLTVLANAEPMTVSLQDGLDGYDGTRDTRIRGDKPTTNYGSNSKLELDGNPDQVSLIRWDTSGIPTESTVTSASITLNVLKTSEDDFEVYESLRMWDELKATYLLAATDQPWEVAGAAGPTDHAADILASLTAPSTGLVTIDLNAQGVAVVQRWIANPAANYGIVIQDLTNETTDDLDVSAREDDGLGPKLTVTYTLGPPPSPNDPPAASNDSYSVTEDMTLNVLGNVGVLLNDTDPDDDPLTATLINDPSSGSLTFHDNGSFTYVPQANFHGQDSFTYRAVDSHGNLSPTATVSLTVSSSNDAPVAASQSVSTPMNTALAVSLSASDEDGDSLTYVIDTAPAHGSLTGTAPNLTYTPDSGFTDTDSFTFHVNDGTVDSNLATVEIVVAPPDPQYQVKHPPRLQLGDAPLVGFSGSNTDQVEVLWETISAGPGNADSFLVQYRDTAETDWSSAGPIATIDTGVEGRIIHSAVIDGLGYDQDYEYRVQHLRSGVPIATYQATFRTRLPANDATPFSFAAYGDSAYLARNDAFRSVQSRINVIDPDFALLLGDNIYNDGSHEQADARFDPTFSPEATQWNSSHIDYVSFGNHELHNGSLGQPTEELFSVPIPVQGQTSSTQPPSSERLEHNYSFDYGNVHFLTFDTNSDGNDQRLDALLTWAEQDLQASNAHWNVVFGHHPIAGAPDKGASPRDNYYQQIVSRLVAAGVDLFLVGHSHTYSRTYPLLGEENGQATYVLDTDNDYAKGDGLVQVISGVGGKSLRDGDFADFPFVAAGFTSDTTPSSEYGFSRIDVTPGQLTVNYVAADGSIIDSFTITGGPPNEPPVPADDFYQVNEDTSLSISASLGVLSNDADPENAPLSAARLSGPAHGSLTLNSNGSFEYTPSNNYNGVDSFTYNASDGINTVAGTVTITVNPMNDAPVASNQNHSIDLDQVLSVALTAIDIDGDALEFIVSLPANGSLSGTAPNLTYTPASGFVGSDSFTFYANDGTTDSNLATVAISVNGVNRPPVANDQSVSTDEDVAVSINLTGSDLDGDSLIFRVEDGPSNGTLSGSVPNLTYTPNEHFNGSDGFRFTVNDGTVDSGIATVAITVDAANDPPVAENVAVTTDLNTAVAVALLGSDVDGDSLSYSIVSDPTSGTLTGTAPNLTYTPNSSFAGTDTFGYQVDDGTSSSSIATVTITVVNLVPVTVSLQDGLDGYDGTRDTRIRGDKPTTNYGSNSKLELDGNPDQVSLIRWDTSGIPTESTVTSASITLNVLKTSEDDFEVYESLRMWDELKATYLLAATDQPWEVAGAAGPTDHAADVLASLTAPSTGLVTIELNAQGVAVVQKWVANPAANYGIVIQDLTNETTDDLDVSAREDDGVGPKLTVTYTLGPPPSPNDPPVASNDSYSVTEDMTLNVLGNVGVLLNDTDPEDDPLSATLTSDPSSGSLTFHDNGSFTYVPQANFHGQDSFTYRAVDSHGNLSPTATVSLTVSSSNDAPVAASQSVSTPMNTALAVSLSASDEDGDSLTYVIDTAPAHGSLSGTAPNLTYTPDSGFVDTDSFTFYVNDGTVDSNLATVEISISHVNSAPVANDQSVSTVQNVARAINLTGSDVDGDSLNFSIQAGPSNGALSGTAPNLTYTPGLGFVGTDSFTFQVNDGLVASNIATVAITVTPVGEPETVSFQNGAFPTPSYDGTLDAGVRGDKPTDNYGRRRSLWLDGNPDQTAFIRWDISGVPIGSTVQSAMISINVENTSVDTFSLYELLAPWTESEATYELRSAETPWHQAGAQGATDRGTTVLGTVTSPNEGEQIIALNAAGLQVVQSWIENPSQNHGIVFQNFENASTDDLDFTSSEGRDPSTRPKLTIQYTPPAASSVALRNDKAPFDVNNDASVSPLDALLVINLLNESAEGETMVRAAHTFPDVSGDHVVSPLDALLVINYLNRPLIVAGEGEGAVPFSSTIVSAGHRTMASDVRTFNDTADRNLPPPIMVPVARPTETASDPNGAKPLSVETFDDVLPLDLETALQLIAEDLVKD